MSNMKRSLYISATLAILLVALGVTQSGFKRTTAAQERSGVQAPVFKVDPLWPKPLPNHWVLGSVTGVAVDAQDHIWITHRGADSLGNNEKGAILNPPTGCCAPAPQVLEFDQSGALIGHWGGPGEGYDWPQSTGAITVDHKGNIWIAAAGQPEPAAGRGQGAAPAAPRPSNAREDAHVIKFSR